jgi:glutamate synthase domain-containing protein 3
MTEMTLKELEQTIKHYIESEDYQSARNYIESYAPKFNSFNKEEALKKVEKSEQKIRKVKEE